MRLDRSGGEGAGSHEFADRRDVAVEAMILALGAALLAGLIPAWRLGRTDPALALKQE